jgi:hypothetical protein
MSDKPLYVTEPALPPFEQFEPLLREIWASHRLTNGGPYHDQLEAALAAYLAVPQVSLLANGTLALMLALKALEVEGEVITTPYSFVATTHALVWSGCTPVFADIDRSASTSTPPPWRPPSPAHRAILAVHVYGRPCDTAGLQAVAERHGLRLIYDAAHAFGVRLDTDSLMARRRRHPQLPRHQGLPHLRGRRHRVPGRSPQGAHRPAAQLRLQGRNPGAGHRHQRQDERAAGRLRLPDPEQHRREIAARAGLRPATTPPLPTCPACACWPLPGVTRHNHGYYPSLWNPASH